MAEDFVIPEPNFPAKAEELIGQQTQIESFRQLLGQSLFTGRTVSAAVLGDWGIGKSSLLLKFAAICSEDNYRMLPVFVLASKELGDYLRFAESLLDRLAVTLMATGTLTARLRTEIQNGKLKRVHVGGLALDREPPQLFLSSGSALLRQALSEAWTRFFRPANLNGAVFLLDDLHNLTGPTPEHMALALRAQFQSFGIDNMNYCVCFSARGDYFGDIRGFAEPAVRFYTKFYLTAFTWHEIKEYVEAVFGPGWPKSDEISRWLYDKTLGHPYFLAFVCRQLAAHGPGMFEGMEREKFCTDLAHATEKELGLLLTLATFDSEEVSPRQFGSRSQSEHFRRLVERGLVVRTARGRYRLYHPLFKLFLQGLRI